MMTGPKELLGSKQMAETWDKAVIAEKRYMDALKAAYGANTLERWFMDSLPHIGRLLRDARAAWEAYRQARRNWRETGE